MSEPTLEELAANMQKKANEAQNMKRDLAAAIVPKLEELQAIYSSDEYKQVRAGLERAVTELQGVNSFAATQAANILKQFDSALTHLEAELANQRNTATMIVPN